MIKFSGNHRNQGASKKRHLIVVTTFIVAASLLVVLTTFAINMLTATGDLNRLMVNWSQNNGESHQSILKYFETADEKGLASYREHNEQRVLSGIVIDELISEGPNTDLIFREFEPHDIHPNEITGLIRIFTFFSQTKEVQHVKNTWHSIQDLSQQKKKLTYSLLVSSDLSGEDLERGVSQLQIYNAGINDRTREIITGNSEILLLLKRYSLWFTVLLGILIVLIGVIFTVRGVKQIKGMEDLLAERDYLAMFPELNQFPVLNVTVDGDIGFMNQATRKLFPKLKSLKLDHPFLKGLKIRHHEITSGPEKNILYEVQVNGKYYQQAAHFLSNEDGIHVHSIDITKLKEQQLEISHTLKEKESLLAEVHHRVKNNMAVITRLLELQEMMGEDPNSALAESRSRIKSMAIVHELLYQANSFSEINMKEYLEKIGQHLRLSLSNINSVKVVNGETSKNLNINQAIPLGLLLNELSFYICKNLDKPIDLLLRVLYIEKTICIKITSDMAGVKNPLKRGGEPTLRMSLINNLLSQIEGTLDVPASKSLNIEIKFSPEIKKGSSSTYL